MQKCLNVSAGVKHTLAYHETHFNRVNELDAKGKLSGTFMLTWRSNQVGMGLLSVTLAVC